MDGLLKFFWVANELLSYVCKIIKNISAVVMLSHARVSKVFYGLSGLHDFMGRTLCRT